MATRKKTDDPVAAAAAAGLTGPAAALAAGQNGSTPAISQNIYPTQTEAGSGQKYTTIPGGSYKPGTQVDGGTVYDSSDGTQRIVYPFDGWSQNYKTETSNGWYGKDPGSVDENGNTFYGQRPGEMANPVQDNAGGADAASRGNSTAGGPNGSTAGMSAADIVKNNANKDAFASLKDTLGQYGLGSLSDFAWQEIVNGRTATEVLQDIRETPQFDQRFPAIKQRQKAGLPALSPGEYVSYEKQATEYMRAAGLPKGFYDDHADFTKFLSNDVSLSELASRVTLAKDAAYSAPSETRQALRGQFGLGDGDLAAFFLDPDKAVPLLQRTYNAANIAGAATRTGFDATTDQDYRLTDQGVSVGQAQAGFDQLGHEKQLFNPLVGHSNEGQISTDTQLAAQFGGNANAQDMIERRRQQRQADFQDGGGFASGQQGLSGLGVSQR